MTTLNLVSWNTGKRKGAIDVLGNTDFDIALLQEVSSPVDSWERKLYDRGADVLPLSDRVDLHKFHNVPQGCVSNMDEISVSAPGIISAARVESDFGKPFIVVSVYARWERPHPQTKTNWGVGYPDAMAHRAISDLSTFIGSIDPYTHRILVAGDFNLIHGALDSNALALPARDRSVFERLHALGFEFVGPKYPDGRSASPAPQGLPKDTLNVPTFHTSRQKPATAANQLDYVFASRGFHETVKTRALNDPQEWGISDHCQIAIDIELS